MIQKVTKEHGGTVHLLRDFLPGMAAWTRCGLVLSQWRDADRTGKRCKRCKLPKRK